MTLRMKTEQQSTGFEPGAKLEESRQAISPHLSRPLESPTGGDHMAALDARFLELNAYVQRRINEAKARADGLHAKAVALNLETTEKAHAGTTAVHLLQQAKNQVGALLEQETRIHRIDLPALEFELASLSVHPTYFALRSTALARVAADLAERNRKISNALVASGAALDRHLESIATPETLALLHALEDAASVAKYDLDPTVLRLIEALAPPPAAA